MHKPVQSVTNIYWLKLWIRFVQDLDRSHDQRRTLEIKLRSAAESVDQLRARHRALRKRIIMLGTKIESRERK